MVDLFRSYPVVEEDCLKVLLDRLQRAPIELRMQVSATGQPRRYVVKVRNISEAPSREVVQERRHCHGRGAYPDFRPASALSDSISSASARKIRAAPASPCLTTKRIRKSRPARCSLSMRTSAAHRSADRSRCRSRTVLACVVVVALLARATQREFVAVGVALVAAAALYGLQRVPAAVTKWSDGRRG